MRLNFLKACRLQVSFYANKNIIRRKMSQNVDGSEDKAIDQQKGITDLSNFVCLRVLSEYGQRKTICLEGNFTDREGKAVVWLEKTPFTEEIVKQLSTEKSLLKREFLNDIYGSYSCFADPNLNAIKTTVIYPATEKHILKFEHKPTHLIEETPALYKTITHPHIKKEQFDITWVYNILDHKQEHERIVFEDDDAESGFVLLPDLKWNGKQTEDLYLLALVRPRGIKSLRDLREEHLPLLKNILNKGTGVIEDTYKIPKDQLRVYIHYQPTFYHLHVHFTSLKYEPPGIFVERAHMLSTVISNIEIAGDYYERATLSFVISEGESLCSEYINKGMVSISV